MLCTVQFIILQEIKIQKYQIRSILILWSYKNVCPTQILGLALMIQVFLIPKLVTCNDMEI